jgi:hypothetical protein
MQNPASHRPYVTVPLLFRELFRCACVLLRLGLVRPGFDCPAISWGSSAFRLVVPFFRIIVSPNSVNISRSSRLPTSDIASIVAPGCRHLSAFTIICKVGMSSWAGCETTTRRTPSSPALSELGPKARNASRSSSVNSGFARSRLLFCQKGRDSGIKKYAHRLFRLRIFDPL